MKLDRFPRPHWPGSRRLKQKPVCVWRPVFRAFRREAANGQNRLRRSRFGQQADPDLVSGFRKDQSVEKGNAALVGSSAPHALFIMIFRGFLGSSAFAVRRKKGKPASRARKVRVVGDGCRGRRLLNEGEHTTKRQLILQNRSLRFCNLASSRLVGATTNLQYLAKISLTRIATSADLRSLRRSI